MTIFLINFVFPIPLIDIVNNKSRSIHNLTGGGTDQNFYQNLSVYRSQNQSHTSLGER